MAEKHRSWIWDHFKMIDKDSVKCKHCFKLMCFGGSTSNLIKHMNRVHSCEDFINDEMKTEEIKEDVDEFPGDQIVQSIDSSCRICLVDLMTVSHVGLQDFLKQFTGVKYLDVFEECTGFNVASDEPQHLCCDCELKLVQAYALRQLCAQTQNVLDKLLAEPEETEMVVEALIEEISEEIPVIQVDQNEIKQEMALEVIKMKPKRPKLSRDEQKTKKPIQDDCNDGEEIVCVTCNSIYRSIRALRNHYKLSHPLHQTQSCPYCHKMFFPQLIDVHLNHCSKRHLVVRQLCPVCGEEASRNHIYRHLARTRALDETGRVIEKPYECDICGARATTKNGIGIHIKSLHLKLKIKCDYCETQVKSRSILATHMRRCHPEVKAPLTCEHCDFQTASAPSLIRHRSIHFDNRPHACEMCRRRFVTKDALRVHTASHFDVRPFPCEVCEAPFKTRKALGAHMKTHKEREYECLVCKKSYLTNQQMRQHMERMHPEYELPPRGTILNKKWLGKKMEVNIEKPEDHYKVLVESLVVDTPETIKEEIFY